ncbi:uncharacterized protein TNCT_213821 [Trichonephila clavata]|uniref:Uncharacterized protein n=1 Tax=Trichonephila clavata TaxID=2740835 RepID=A0A8X6F9I9_TRICU|nr:uncharacterized protein TNCT_213821 [Trichonephila clavata]
MKVEQMYILQVNLRENRKLSYNDLHHNGTNAGPSAHDPSQHFPELYAFSSFYIEWYFWIIILVICCTIIALALLCMICCRKPYKTAVVRLSEEIPSHFPGTVLAPEGIIQPDVSFYTQVQPCNALTKSPNIETQRTETPRMPTPCKPLEPAYQPTQLLTITTVRLPYLTSDLALPPGYVSLRDIK